MREKAYKLAAFQACHASESWHQVCLLVSKSLDSGFRWHGKSIQA